MQVADEPVPDRVQLAGLKVPVPLLIQLTVPVGVIAVPGEAVTVTVQTMLPLAFEQLTVVDVVRFVTVRLNEPKLPEWPESPIYASVITWVPSEPGLGV